MKTGLRYKFSQNLALREKLLGTGDKPIFEHTVNDSYWGDGGDGSGKNRLGLILMELREEFRNQSWSYQNLNILVLNRNKFYLKEMKNHSIIIDKLSVIIL